MRIVILLLEEWVPGLKRGLPLIPRAGLRVVQSERTSVQ